MQGAGKVNSEWGQSILAQCCITYRNQSFDLQCKLNDLFLYEMQQKAKMG